MFFVVVMFVVQVVALVIFPEPIRDLIYSVLLGASALAEAVVLVLAELRWKLPEENRQGAAMWIIMPFALVILWGFVYSIQSWEVFLALLRAPGDGVPEIRYIYWVALKIGVVLILVRIVGAVLRRRGKGRLVQLLAKTGTMLMLGAIPYPRVFGDLLGELIVSSGICAAIDSLWDLAEVVDSPYEFALGGGNAALVLLMAPGVYGLASRNMPHFAAALLTAFFATLMGRYFYAVFACLPYQDS